MTSHITRIALCACGVISLGCSTDTGPLTSVPNGEWSDESAHMVVTDAGATIDLVCENDIISQPLTLDAAGNFDWLGTAQPNLNLAGSPTHAARFTGQATSREVVITRTITDASSIDPTTHTLVRGPRTFAPCP